jgi:hypothetical protein
MGDPMNQQTNRSAVSVAIGLAVFALFMGLLSFLFARGLTRAAGLVILGFLVIVPFVIFFCRRGGVSSSGSMVTTTSNSPGSEPILRNIRNRKLNIVRILVLLPFAIAYSIAKHLWLAALGVSAIGLFMAWVLILELRQLRKGLNPRMKSAT